jgi:Integrase core domain
LRRPVESGQYTSLVFTRRCRAVDIEVSMGSRGDCFDNAVLESFHATLKKDLIRRRPWPTKAEARTAVFGYIEAFYNRRRRHSRLGMLSPVEFETGTLRTDGASLAASRLASIDRKIKEKLPNPSRTVSTEAGRVHLRHLDILPARALRPKRSSVHETGPTPVPASS